jgi:exonuclease V
LISDNNDFQTTCLDDVVTSWHKLVERANIQGINDNLELVYRLRPPPDRKQKSKAISLPKVDDCDTPKDVPVPKITTLTGAENSTAGPSKYMGDGATITEGLGAKLTSASVSDLEDAQLQWALQQSMMPQSDQEGEFPGM